MDKKDVTRMQHKNLTKNRWGKMIFVEQMANIGSEISRASHWRIKNNVEYSNNVVNRALELITFTIASISASVISLRLSAISTPIPPGLLSVSPIYICLGLLIGL